MKLRRILMSLGIIYLIISNFGYILHIRSTKEIFPFFNWFLFVTVPDPKQVEYNVIIYRFEGNKLNPPKYFKDAPDVMVNKSSNALIVIRRLGEAYVKGDEKAFQELRTLFEKNYVKGHISYELVVIRVDYLNYWRTGQVDKIKSLIFLSSPE